MIDIVQGDCLEIMKSIDSGSIDLVVTDPPYKVTSSGNTPSGYINGHWRKSNGEANPVAKKGGVFKHNKIRFDDWMPEVFRVLAEQTHFYCMTNDLHLSDVIESGIRAGFKRQNVLVWAKGMHTPTQYYFKNIEFIVMFRKGRAKYINNIGTKALLDVKGIRGKEHPSEKPSELMAILIENSSKIGELVLDPFAGSGSVGVACLNTGRKFVGVELDDKYYLMAKERIASAGN